VACNSRFGSGQFIETLLSVSFADDFSNKFTVTEYQEMRTGWRSKVNSNCRFRF